MEKQDHTICPIRRGFLRPLRCATGPRTLRQRFREGLASLEFALIAPVVEELTFRGAGQSLLLFLGRTPSILAVGVAFGLAHGLVEALLVLVPFGIALAWLRDRTRSILPGMLVHGLFNGLALAISVLG